MASRRQARTPESVQLDAVRDVLRAISEAPFDLAGVLGIACEHVVRLTGADYGYVFVPEDGHMRAVGSARAPADMDAYMREHPIPIDLGSTVGRAILTGLPSQIPDVLADPDWNLHGAQRLGGYRSTMSVPLLKEGRVIGVLTCGRRAVGAFPDEDVELVRTFADQAAIMVDNVRLLGTVERQRDELAQYLSPKVAGMLSSPESAQRLAAHRSEISAVYCDLRGFTAFTASSEPEEVINVLSVYQREMGSTVMAHGGTLEGYAGDGLMAFLNDPVPVPNHAREAISMALEMQQRFASLAANWSRRGWELGLGIGLSTGYATVGRVGFEGYYRYAAIGSVANIAARLCAIAEPGQVVISAATYAEVESHVVAKPLGPFELKGLGRPVEAYDVTAVTN